MADPKSALFGVKQDLRGEAWCHVKRAWGKFGRVVCGTRWLGALTTQGEIEEDYGIPVGHGWQRVEAVLRMVGANGEGVLVGGSG